MVNMGYLYFLPEAPNVQVLLVNLKCDHVAALSVGSKDEHLCKKTCVFWYKAEE